MDRLACVDLPALPLQLLLRRNAPWQGYPVAVVAEDRPQGEILWVNEQARRCRVLPGQRYAQGLALAAELRAGTVSEREIERAVDRLAKKLRGFSPRVEPSRAEPGLFWLDASGLERLTPSLQSWGGSIQQALSEEGFSSTVVVGFSRFGSYALARGIGETELFVCDSPDEERRLGREVPLERLGLEPALREVLERLGIVTVGQLLQLPAGGLCERFGAQAHRLHRLATGALWDPLQPEEELPPLASRLDLDHAESDVTRLLFLLKRRLDRVLRDAAGRGEALVALELRLALEDRRVLVERVRPAAPTLDGGQLLDLLRLRLGSTTIAAGVETLELRGEGVRASQEQLQLFAARPRRDPEAANRALARLRAELGERAVVRATLQPRHLPEASFAFEPLERLPAPQPGEAPEQRAMVRRLHREARAIPAPRNETCGPFILSGGWWSQEVHREYHYTSGLSWIYYDRERRRWLRHGRVE